MAGLLGLQWAHGALLGLQSCAFPLTSTRVSSRLCLSPTDAVTPAGGARAAPLQGSAAGLCYLSDGVALQGLHISPNSLLCEQEPSGAPCEAVSQMEGGVRWPQQTGSPLRS